MCVFSCIVLKQRVSEPKVGLKSVTATCYATDYKPYGRMALRRAGISV